MPRRILAATHLRWLSLVLCLLAVLGNADAAVRGLPFSRTYSLEDIGYVPRGSRLNFDAFGRIAVIHDGVYAVLNDTAWQNLVDAEESARTPMAEVVHGGYGRSYYSGRFSWGMAEFGPDGKLHAKPLVPPNAPAWTRVTTFDGIIVTVDGVYFTSRNGFVYWDFARKECDLIEVPRTTEMFALGNRVYVSANAQPLRYFSPKERTLNVCPNPALDRTVIDRATSLDERRALISSTDGRMFVFDGQDMTPWEGQVNPELQGRISVLRSLSDGNVAIAINGKGVFVVSPEGKLLSSLTTPQYHQVSSIASRERGVMWLLTEDAIEKVLYGGGLTSFGQRVGLTLGWPMVAYSNGRLVVASDGVLYQAISTDANAATRFERMAHQPPGGARTMTSFGRHVLIGSPSGIFSLQPDGDLKRIGQVRELRTLVLLDENQCYAFGRAEIALLEWDGKRWSESAPRIPGLANSFHAHRTTHAVWAEMGGDGVARIARRDGKIHLTVLPNDPSIKERWVNIGVLGSVAVLSTLNGQRRFYNDETEKWCDMPEIAKLLDRSPRWLARMWRDDSGTIWASHSEGVVKFEPANGDYRMDTSTFDLINDRYPLVQILGGKDVWLSAGRSLHHVEQLASTAMNAIAEPVLVSLMDTRRNVELLTKRFQEAPLQLSFAQNSLTFQLFSGSYARRRPPIYEFRLNPQETWTRIDTGSLLRFANLREGKYHLQVRSGADSMMSSPALAFAFEIMPPWHRTWPAYVLWATVVLVVAFAIGRLSSHLAHKRNRALEQLVRDRTGELELTMQKFNEETRISATLAERDRLAGEIHDSVQQGLSGAILQLDTTLKLPAVTAELRRRLDVVRNMVSYAGQEVQHAVWDMESPLITGSDLGAALRKLATHTASSEYVPTVSVTGTPVALPRVATHHLLRIAQEATTNAVRHAKAQSIGIRLDYGADSVALTISDDGDGFQPDDTLNQSGHFGLRGIRGRAKKLGGKLTITSAPHAGTSIHILVPLPASTPISRDAETSRSS